MITYIATFYSHYGAIQFRRNCEAMNLKAEVMPVPRDLRYFPGKKRGGRTDRQSGAAGVCGDLSCG